MQSRPILGCALNFSEGRRSAVIDEVAGRAAAFVPVLDVFPDPDHNRTVLTIAGAPAALVDAVVAAGHSIVSHVDLSAHQGVHPRTGAVDVVPFYPLGTTSPALAVNAAQACSLRLWHELRLPSFLYEQASPAPVPRTLPWVRRQAFVDLEPDTGGPEPHPTAGAAVVGARGLLVAYNVLLDTPHLGTVRRCAALVRAGSDGNLRTLGLYLASRDATQVSMNILYPQRFTLAQAYRAVTEAAEAEGTAATGSQIVGLVPRACLGDGNLSELRLERPPKVIEDLLDRLEA